MKSHELRQKFISYFQSSQHRHVPSSRLVPEGDPTLLFINAGMNQFKNTFLGVEQRDYSRAVTAQKCVRAGGKHNDLENVGHTARHHTFFEMLGNFSFGDYFKKEAIHFAWEFIIKELGLPKDKLYVTVFKDDDEAADIWHKQEGVPRERIYRFGEKDNFWRMGDTGPCGPCSEIFYDLGPEVGGNPKDNVMGGDGDRYMEFWNLVFMQFFEDGSGQQNPLPNPSIDTGMGLERLTTILQGEINNYHTDVFQDIITAGSRVCGVNYLKSLKDLSPKETESFEASNVAFRVLADHARASGFLIADGVLPSNEGRGYVLRRILRRAIRYGRNLSEDKSLLPPMVEAVIEKMSDFYPELKNQSQLILNTVRDEESRFLQTLDQGTLILRDEMNKRRSRGQQTLDGDLLFKLYDTFGFPVDLTRIMASEEGFRVDEEGFEKKMHEARTKAKASWKGKALGSDEAHVIKLTQSLSSYVSPAAFTGYNHTTESDARLVGLSNGSKEVDALKAGETGLMIFDKTCFYAESGGQVGDTGKVQSSSGVADVLDCTKINNLHVHQIKVVEGDFKKDQACSLQVEVSERRNIAANHSATHLLHSALRKVLGTHVQQAGSLVEADRLRFDFTHNKPLSHEEIEQIESFVNREIAMAHNVGVASMSPDEAIKKGALALFGEKYGDEVRVIDMGPFSMELCGGTHVSNTAMIRVFKLVSEGGVSAGVRRIEAITGDKAFDYLMKNTSENLATRESLGLPTTWTTFLEDKHQSLEVVSQLKEQIRQKEKEIQSLKGGQVDLDALMKSATAFEVEGEKALLVLADLQVDDRKVLSEVTDKLKDKVQTGVVVVVGQGENSHPLIVSVSKNLTKKVNAGQMLKLLAETMGGKGGGRPDFAQGAVPDRSKIGDAFAQAKSQLGVK